MDCKEFEKNIPIFINSKMEYEQLKSFVDHVNTCEECREELDIQLLISEGIARLEDDGTLDLRHEMDKRMKDAQQDIRVHKTLRVLVGTLQVMAIIAFLIILILLFI